MFKWIIEIFYFAGNIIYSKQKQHNSQNKPLIILSSIINNPSLRQLFSSRLPHFMQLLIPSSLRLSRDYHYYWKKIDWLKIPYFYEIDSFLVVNVTILKNPPVIVTNYNINHIFIYYQYVCATKSMYAVRVYFAAAAALIFYKAIFIITI